MSATGAHPFGVAGVVASELTHQVVAAADSLVDVTAAADLLASQAAILLAEACVRDGSAIQAGWKETFATALRLAKLNKPAGHA